MKRSLAQGLTNDGSESVPDAAIPAFGAVLKSKKKDPNTFATCSNPRIRILSSRRRQRPRRGDAGDGSADCRGEPL